MRNISVAKTNWMPQTKHEHARSTANLIDEPCVLRDSKTNELIAAQLKLRSQSDDLAKIVERLIKFDLDVPMDTARLSGIESRNRVFGTVEPNKLRRRVACSAARLDKENPRLLAALTELANQGIEQWCEIDDATFTAHKNLVETKIHPDWLLGETGFTSGVINFTAALPYHKDSGNIPGSWSMMLALRSNVEGGHLHLPEYDVTLGIFDRSITFFNGQAVWHGVTPFHLNKKTAHRFTIVFYAKNKIAQCGCKADELKRVQQEASQ